MAIYAEKIKKYSLSLLIAFSVLVNNARAEKVLQLGNFYSTSGKSLSEKILEHAYKRLHINIEIVYLPAERSLWMANNGGMDGEVSRLANLEKIYPHLLRVNIPLEVISLYAYSNKTPLTITGWQSLKPYRIAYLRGVKVIEHNLRGFSAEGITNIEQIFTMLAYNRVNIIIIDKRQATEIPAKYHSIKVLKPLLYSFPVYHYLNKKHAHLIAPLEIVLKQMLVDKTINRLEREFTNELQKPP